MAARAQRAVRASGWVGAAILAACLALTVTAPPCAASDVRAGAARASAVTGPSGVLARAAAIAVAGTGQVLWSRDLNTELPMASITKVMTALVVIRAGDLSRKITVPAAVVGYVEEHDASNAGLWPGDTLTASQLLEALLLPSGADAAYTLAAAYGPGLVPFIAKMNATARLLGMTRTHFSNFDGLPWPTAYSTYSTPANLIKLGRVAMTSAVFRSIVDRRSDRIAAGPGIMRTSGRTSIRCSACTGAPSGSRPATPRPRVTACSSRSPGAARRSSESPSTVPASAPRSTEPTRPRC